MKEKVEPGIFRVSEDDMDVTILAAHVEGVRTSVEDKIDSLRNLMDERDRRYEDRFTAMDEKTSLALTASEKAVTKAEIATEKRFDSVNEFRGQLKDQAATLLPRMESDSRFKSYDEKFDEMKKEIINLREFRSMATGQQSQVTSGLLQRNWGVGMLIMAFFSIAGLVISVISAFKH